MRQLLVDSLVNPETGQGPEVLVTLRAREGLLATVVPPVGEEVAGAGVRLAADVTDERHVAAVEPPVCQEAGGAAEAPAALWAFEGLLSGVILPVCQKVGQ